MATTTTLPDITHEADVKALVDSFYDKVNEDALLSPIFKAIAQVYWPTHLFTMYDFWSSVLLGSVRHKSRSFPNYLGLPIEGEYFQRWLKLFSATVDEKFSGTKAEEAKTKALNIPTLFSGVMQSRSMSLT